MINSALVFVEDYALADKILQDKMRAADCGVRGFPPHQQSYEMSKRDVVYSFYKKGSIP